MDWSDDCLTAFKNKDYDEAVRLLPLLVEIVRMEIHSHQKLSLGTMLSKYTTSITNINFWEYDNLKAGLLHLSSRNGW